MMRLSTRDLNPSKPHASSAFSLVTLNIGGRNTNPLEFLLEGDESEVGQQAVQIRARAQVPFIVLREPNHLYHGNVINVGL